MTLKSNTNVNTAVRINLNNDILSLLTADLISSDEDLFPVLASQVYSEGWISKKSAIN